ncbi:MAG: cation:proton antiporter [Alphaproteobacteria bacterium]
MNGSIENLPLLILLIGATVVAAMILRGVCRRIGVPALVAYMLLGVAVRFLDVNGDLLSGEVIAVYEFLGGIGVVTLLFRVGLEADARDMLQQFRRAAWVWIGNVAASGLAGFATAYYLLGIPLIPSLFAGVALTATSLGICLGVWREAGRLHTPSGALLTDVAELDDVSGVVLMILLISIAPILFLGNGDVVGALGQAGFGVLVKIAGFAAVCIIFAYYLERPLTAFFERLEPSPSPMLPIAGMVLVIAAVAGWLGFSLAVGALFAGLIFSREKAAPQVDEAFSPLYDFFSPFFFVSIGLLFEPGLLIAGLAIGAPLLVAGVFGKVAGTVIPALSMTSLMGGLILGVSMVPRAEIALVIAFEGRRLGDWAMPPELFAGIVLVSLTTSLVTPIVVARLLSGWTPRLKGESAPGEPPTP